MEITAKANFLRIAPDKIRNLSNLVKGKSIEKAIAQLEFSGKNASKPLILVLKQAKDQAKDKNIQGDLIVKTIQVNEGPKLKRRRIRQQGRATAILKRGSHIIMVLADDTSQKQKPKSQKDKEIKKEKNGTQS